MASAHLHASIGSRAKGHSAVAAASYRARSEMVDERTGLQHDYSRHRSKCVWSGIYAPKDAPEWTRDSAQLWNHVEAFEKRGNSELFREVEISLPHELTLEQNRRLLQDWIKENVTRKGLICEAFIHEPPRGGDPRNIHAHVMMVMRPLDGTEFQRTKERFDSYGAKQAHWAEALDRERTSWEKHANRHLERYGHEARINMGRKQNGDEATIHLGKKATAQERRGHATDRGDENRDIEEANEQRRQEAANENQPASRQQQEPPQWFEEQNPPPFENTPQDLTPPHEPDPRDLARGRTEDGSVIYLHHEPEQARQHEPPQWFEEHAPPQHQHEDDRGAATTPADHEAEATHAPENRPREAAPARPSYLPPIVIPLSYDPAPHLPDHIMRPAREAEAEATSAREAFIRRGDPTPGLADHIMRPAREAQAEERAWREVRVDSVLFGIEARIAEAEQREAAQTPEERAQAQEAHRQEQEDSKLGPVSENPPSFRSVWDEVRDHTRQQRDETPRGMIEPVSEREVPEIRPRPGMIFIGKCLEWGIAMAGKIMDAIASIFETRDERREQGREAERLRPPPPPPPQLTPPRRSLLDEARAELEAESKQTQQQREAVDRLRDVLRDPDNTRHRGHHR